MTIQGSDYTSYDWDFGRLQEPSETMISIDADQKDSNNWALSARDVGRCPT